MPDVNDSLAFSIAFALTHKTGGNAKKLIRSLSEKELDYVAREVAEHFAPLRVAATAARATGKGRSVSGCGEGVIGGIASTWRCWR